ncbi:glycosyltransferase family 4 protein [Burkholderia ubonensis]|uniref:glycosyltransferase family 4 protein n=1 Tax=Burkholderia ubonensis TaxID=101571 RepID=UPI000754CBCC|nr:glycosyltransferase family 4 protein [Burkholderia ubonensis]KVP52242.1 glycosyl transferase [Burkholderia ubonensis]
MKIMLVVGSLGGGGAERVAATLVNAWAERGDDVTLVSTFSGRGDCFYEISSRVRIVYLADLVRSTATGALNAWRRFIALRRLIRTTRADVVVSFLAHVNIAVIAASRGTAVPVIACEHTNPIAAPRGRFQRFMARCLYPRADVLTVLTAGIVDPLCKEIPALRNVVVLPNPVDADVLRFWKMPGTPGSRKRVLAAGRLHPIKQFDVLIDAFSTLAHEFPDWDLYIWGEGPTRDALARQIGALKLDGRVFLPGMTRELWAEMANADIYALTSHFEGLPMAMMEAMAIGLPCVAFDCPSGPRELTRDGRDGVLVDRRDVGGLVAALRELFSSEYLRGELGRKAAASVRERFSTAVILARWDRLYARVGAIRGRYESGSRHHLP